MSLAPTSLDARLELRGLAGEGAMGEVHRAWDRQLERAVAVKFVHGDDPREASRLLLEARLQARVDHPSVIRVHEVGKLEGRNCIVFQLVDGRTLAALSPELPIEARVELLRQAALGLHAAHLQGLVHRDVKPGNILVEEGPDGSRRALLGDFGLARGEEGGLTRTGVPPGTPEYMSPEQLLGGQLVDHRSDVYSLGATLYGLVAGRPPFRSSTGALEGPSVGVRQRALDEEPEPLREVAPGAPRGLGFIVAKAMEKDPSARYASAAAFAEDLRRHLCGERLQAGPPPPLDRGRRWAHQHPFASRAIGAGVAVLLVAGGVAVWTSRRDSLLALDDARSEASSSRRSLLDALEASRVGAEVERMASLVRDEELLPAHDLSPALAEVRATMAQIQRSGQGTGTGAGATAFGLGRGHQILGDLVAAHRDLLKAWSLGFRNRDVARALGEVEGARYQEAMESLPRTGDPSRSKEQIAELRREWRDPAIEHLKAAAGAEGSGSHALAARIALLEGRFEDAAAAAERASRSGRHAVEGRLLEAEARIATGQLQAAEAALRSALEIGRSAPGPRILLARVLLERARATTVPGEKERMFAAALAALDEAARFDARAPGLLTARQEVQAAR